MAALSDYAIVTLNQAKQWLGIDLDDDSHDVLLIDIINAVTDAIENYLGRNVVSREVTEEFSGTGSNEFVTQHAPIQALLEITVEDAFSYNDEDCADKNLVRYDPVNGIIWLLQQRFYRGYPLNCTVVYVGGWRAVPAAIERAALMMIKNIWSYRERQGQAATMALSVGGISQSITYIDNALADPTVMSLLEPYRRRRYR